MKVDSLLGDPVFQLNLLLWMAKEQPADGYRVKPLFHKLGFKIIYIENPFPLPPTDAEAATASGLEISTAPEPELILGRDHDGGIHPYPAKFIREIPRALINLFHPGDNSPVFDPFCGSGTTLVESMIVRAGYSKWEVYKPVLDEVTAEIKRITTRLEAAQQKRP